MRRSMSKENIARLTFPVPFWPVAPILTIIFMAFIIAVLGYFPDTRIAMYVGVAWVALMTLAWWVWLRKASPQSLQEPIESLQKQIESREA